MQKEATYIEFWFSKLACVHHRIDWSGGNKMKFIKKESFGYDSLLFLINIFHRRHFP